MKKNIKQKSYYIRGTVSISVKNHAKGIHSFMQKIGKYREL